MTLEENYEKRLRYFRAGYMLGTAVAVGNQNLDDAGMERLDDADFMAGWNAAVSRGSAALEAAGIYIEQALREDPEHVEIRPGVWARREDVRKLIKSGFAGVDRTGKIVDIREVKDATPYVQ